MRQDIKVTYFSDIVGRFDKDTGMIYGVSVITEGKAKGHDLVVDSQTLMDVKKAAESFPDGRLKTKLNHRSGVEAVFGYLENFRISGPKLLADMKMLKAHKDFEQTFEQIEQLPNQIGLSVAFVGKEAHASNGQKLARCREILSADLVPEPAANPTGMFSAKVDTEKIDMNEPNATAGGKAAGATQDAEPTNREIMDFLKTQVVPRIEATEAFQQAIQDELNAAGNEGEGDEGLTPGDDGNKSATGAAGGGAASGAAEGGTRGGGAAGSPAQRSAAAAGQVHTGVAGSEHLTPAGAGATEMSQLREAVVTLERRIADKENQEREVQFESAMGVIKEKTEALIEQFGILERENEILLEALRTGVKPVKNSPGEIFFDTGKAEDFQSRVKKHRDAGKSKTEAVMLARKEDPHAHTKWLESQGVVSTL